MSNPTPELATVPIDSIVPYWRNPRNSDQAVDHVARSIEEYGYQAPIIVDQKMTIIVGHTRYRALKQLGYTEAAVLISPLTPRQAKAYRIIDNRTSEYATWNPDHLTQELKELDTSIADNYFPHITLTPDFTDTDPYTDTDVTTTQQQLADQFTNQNTRTLANHITLHCPHCLDTYTMDTNLLRKELDRNEQQAATRAELAAQ